MDRSAHATEGRRAALAARAPALLAACVTAVVMGVAVLYPAAAWSDAVGRWGQALAEAVAAASCAWVSRRLDGRGRLAWGLFAAGLAIWAVTDAVAGAAAWTGLDPQPPSLFDVAWLAFYLPMLAGAVVFYDRFRPERGWQGILDAAAAAITLGVLSWVLIVAPRVHHATGGVVGTAVDMLYPALDLACLISMCWLLGRRGWAGPGWLWWIAAAFGLTLVANTAYLVTYLDAHVPAEALATGAYMGAGWAWYVAARRRGARPSDRLDAPSTRSAPPLWSGAIPAVCGIVVAVVAARGGDLIGVLTAVALVLIGVRTTLASRLTGALLRERAARERRLNAVLDEQAALLRVAEAVAADPETTALFNLVAREASDLLGADCGMVWGFDQSRGEVFGAYGADAESVGVSVDLTCADPMASVARTCHAAESTSPYEGDDAGLARYRHGVAAPVMVRGCLWGCLHVAATRGPGQTPFVPEAIRQLERFAGLVGVALGNAEDSRRLRSQAATDALTGLANHGAFQDRLVAEWDHACRHQIPLALVLIDLDHFKRVNDTFGHPTGDAVLRELAQRLRRASRGQDVLARVGGEEFAWILPGADERDALAAAERARALVRETPFADVGRLTASFGVCDTSDASGPSELHLLADEALYTAKHAGRDRVCGRRRPEAWGDDGALTEAQMVRLTSIRGVLGLARAVDARDPATHRHSARVADLAVQLATALSWTDQQRVALRDAALLHDVGKIAVPDRVLLRTGPLSAEDVEELRTHPSVGAAIVAGVLNDEQVSWVRHHHECVDGSGYPEGLRGDQIPMGARIISVAEAVDAMLSERPDRPLMSLEQVVAECARCAGTQFDPVVVDALQRLAEVDALTLTAGPRHPSRRPGAVARAV